MSPIIKRYLIGAGISFMAMAAVCMLIYPEVFQHYEYGVSYFGSVSKTFIPYYLGFALTIMFVGLVALKLRHFNDKTITPLRLAFWTIAICMTGVAITSYSLGHMVYAIHWAFAIALTLCIVAIAVGLLVQGGLSNADYALITILFITIILSALPLIHHIPYFRVYIPRELIVFSSSLLLLSRATLRRVAVLELKTKST
jgi:hypothetical protein